MRKWAIMTLLAGLVLPACASNRVTVAQVEQAVMASQTRTDGETARQLGDMELTERLSSARVEQLRTHLPGERSQQALIALADASAFLDPPAAEIPGTATPDVAAQRRILALTVDYLGKTLPLLPNLFAARDTMRFETRPEPAQAEAVGNPMREASKSRVTVLYRDGHEFVDAGADKDKKAHAPDRGLTTWGEFGPILGTVLIDAARSKLSWSHWELAASGPQAVFHYAVPKEKSHYDVRFCCITQSYGFETSVLTERVGYQGEITVDPDSGTILRLTALADIDAGNPIGLADIAVEYGPEEIAGKTFFCPVRGIALAQAPDLKTLHSALNPPPSMNGNAGMPKLEKASLSSIAQGPRQMLLNDVAFREYHFFRAETKMVPSGGTRAVAAANETANSAPEAATSLPADAGKPVEDTAVDSSTLGPQPAAGSSTARATDSMTLVATAEMPERGLPEITVMAADGLPSAPALPQTAADSAATLRLTARLVDVPLVALDKKGRPMTNLKPEDLEIYDNGQKVDVRSFVQAGVGGHGAEAAPAAGGSSEPAAANGTHAFSNHPLAVVKSATDDQQDNTVVLLIDDTLSFDDLSNVREQMLTFLKQLPEDQRVSLYVMRVGGFQILQERTTEHAVVAETLKKWRPTAQSVSLGDEQEARNRQSMDYVRDAEDLLNVNGHTQLDSTSNTDAPDPKLRTLGDNPGRDALSGLVTVARHLGAIAGHKNLVWIASDNTLADWTNGSLNIDKGARVIQSSVLRAQEAMNDAHVSVYPLDASRLEVGGIDASIGTRNVALNPAATANQVGGCGLISNPGSTHSAPAELTNGPDITTCQNDLHPGRMLAQMQQDLHPIQGAYRELADATGGRTFRRASDMVSEFNSVVSDGRATYLLSFTPALAADGKYHLITVKLAGRKDVKLRYRSGFFYREEPSTLKDRFSETVLESQDATQIALTADPLPGSNGRTVKLDIAATDLAIAQKDSLWTDKLDVFVVQRAVSGNKARVTGQTMGLRLKPATYQQYLREGIPFNQALEPAPGVGSVRIVVLDENSGRMGSVTIPAAVIGNAN